MIKKEAASLLQTEISYFNLNNILPIVLDSIAPTFEYYIKLYLNFLF